MAGAALVGGSFLSAFLQVLFDRMARREVLDFFGGQKLSAGLLKRLKTTMISVNGVLDDAEEKQITKPAVKTWINELKDAVYEADDFLDDIDYEALRLELESGSQTATDQVQNFLSSLNPIKKGMEVKLNDIIERLEYLVKQKDALGLRVGIVEKQSSQKIPTTCLVDESGVYGRDDDKEAIIKLLLSDDKNSENPGIVPIVGMGGVGKTTLAQLVYNDSRVVEWFDLEAWVCVSEEFEVFKVTKNILKEVTSIPCDTMTPNRLQLYLKEKLIGNKFLLVLDDVWHDKYVDWDILLRPLKFGEQGSKVVVTTRNESVASAIGTVPSHHLKELSENDCWLLFAKHAFGNSGINPDLEVIGEEIARKCRGVPLAAKTLGGLLRSTRDAKEWIKISKSRIWDSSNDSILSALRLSYHYLPSHLKRCFSYCAIFPKDHKFKKENLVLLWMAEGLLVQHKGNMEMEEVGEEYFHDLVSRSFFQQSSVNRSLFIMHDLINDLAKFVSEEFCFRLEGDNSYKIDKKARHLSYIRAQHDDSKKFEDVYGAQLLRTFLAVKGSSGWSNSIDMKVMHDLLLVLKRLRVLSLSWYHNIDNLPVSIGTLKHLRYLDLSETSIKRLPDSVSNLYNLQTLILCECDKLVLLPDSIGNLKNLRYLDLSLTSIKRLPESVSRLYNLQTLILYWCGDLVELPTNIGMLINLCYIDIRETKLLEMPSQIGKLTKLQKLTDFVVGKQSGSSIKELGLLQQLWGELCIWNLHNVVDSEDAKKANLMDKKQLNKLTLRWAGETENSEHERVVLGVLLPHTNMEYLTIVGYGGTKFPCWIGDSSFSNIVSLELSECKYCFSLPPLGQLVSLKDLSITAFHGIVVVGPEFYGSCMSSKNSFGSLETLSFERMAEWQKWITYEVEGADGPFPLLRELYIRECPSLIEALPGHLPSLATLKIEGCPLLVSSLPRAPAIIEMKLKDDSRDVLFDKFFCSLIYIKDDKFHSQDSLLKAMEKMCALSTILEDMTIADCNSLHCFPLELFPKLKFLRISRCLNLKTLFAPEATQGYFKSLSLLEISECLNLITFPKGRAPVPNLTQLRLLKCLSLKSLPECMSSVLPCLLKLEIMDCPELDSFPEGGLPLKLEFLKIHSCKKLIAGRRQWDLHVLPSFSHFSIGTYEDLEAFPEETLLPSILTSLEILNLLNLKILDCNGLQSLTSLTELTINTCPGLQSIPEEGLPSTLTTLNMLHLQNLKSLDKWLQHLTSLRELRIQNCPKIQSMPEGLPCSISYLFIEDCPLLEERCELKERNDWSKISYIPRIFINGYKNNSSKILDESLLVINPTS